MSALTPHRIELLCPACGYDVGQTLKDGFKICPECGEAISAVTCRRTEDHLPAKARIGLYLVWLSPAAAATTLFALPPDVVLVLLSLSLVMVYWSMWRVERWLGTAKPAIAALGPTGAIVITEMVCPPVMVVLILAFILIEGYPLLFSPRESDTADQ